MTRRLRDGVLSFDWTPEAVVQLQAMRSKGKSASQIAAAFGVSRNAVIGKMQRLGTSAPASLAKEPVAKAAKATLNAEPKPIPTSPSPSPSPRATRPVALVPAEPVCAAPEPEPPPATASSSARAVSLTELRDHHCRWPLWSDAKPDRLYCGDIRDPNSKLSYCRHHLAVHAGPGTPSEQRAVRDAARAA